ncbi:MAG: type II secretion system F family protein [Lachnospiraceae bacterium]|nr:type II secretion system F family protein [Lachnospiraceae bacterium]
MKSTKGKTITGKIFVGCVVYVFASALVSYLFYDSFYMCGVFLVLLPIYLKRTITQYEETLRQELKSQFCDMIGSVSASLAGGMSPENAFIVARNDMERMYSEDSIIVKELNRMIEEVSVNISIQTCLKKFSERTDVEDIINFATVFNEAMCTGGNLSEIIKDTVFIMQDKRRTEDEIASLLKGKMLEQKVICVIPFGILVYLRFTSNEFIKVLYHNVVGNIIMSACLILYFTSVIMSEKIINIKV